MIESLPLTLIRVSHTSTESEVAMMAQGNMTAACKARLLERMNKAWPLSDWRFVDVAVVDEQVWNIVSRHQVTGEQMCSRLLKSELQRAEANNQVVCRERDGDGYDREFR